MRKINFKNIIVFIALALAVALFATGCRPSPALEEIVYTDTATVVDYKHEKLQQEDEGETDEDFENETDENADSQNDTDDSLGTGEEGEGEGKEIVYDENGNSDATVEGTKKTTDSEEDSNSELKEDSDEEEDSGEADGSSEDGDSDKEIKKSGGEEEDDPEISEDPDDEGNVDDEENDEESLKRTITDADGNEQKLPENVDLVAACGYAAEMVEMIGGSGRLVASNENFTSNWLANTIFDDVSDGSVKTLWSGDGSRKISDENFETLLSIEPGVVIEISGENTLSSSQIKKLNKKGIGYITVPALKTSENLQKAARIIAEVLTDNGSGGSASSVAEKYCSWIDTVLNDVYAGDAAYYSTYVSGWHDDITYSFGKGQVNLLPVDSNGTGSGVATGYSNKANVLITEFMNAAGVTNEASSTPKSVKTDEVYLTPMFRNLKPSFSSDTYTYYTGNQAASTDWGLVHIIDGEVIRLGGNNFNSIIVANNNIKTAIENSWYWQWHGNVEKEGISGDSIYINDEDTGEVFWSSICGNYNILVNPSGFENWAIGSVDSPLEAYWVADKIAGTVSDSSLYSNIKKFYNDFFGVSLDDSDVDYILQGE